jgi:hypothetical protein
MDPKFSRGFLTGIWLTRVHTFHTFHTLHFL